jgi:hypothetical protein
MQYRLDGENLTSVAEDLRGIEIGRQEAKDVARVIWTGLRV